MKYLIVVFILTFVVSCGGSKRSPRGNGNTSNVDVASIANCGQFNNCQATITNPPPTFEFELKLPNTVSAQYEIRFLNIGNVKEQTVGTITCGNGRCDTAGYFFQTDKTGEKSNVSVLSLYYGNTIFDYNHDTYGVKIVKK